jgi:DNA replication protein DnaC
MDLFLDLRDANKKGSATSEKDVLAKPARAGLLVIDEYQERGESEWENRIISNLIDRRYAERKPTILIANMSREQMGAALGASICDRVRECGRPIIFNWSSYRANET